MQRHSALGDHIGRPVPPPARFHRHLRVRTGGGDLTGQVDGAVVDPTPRHPVTIVVQHDDHRPLSMQIDPYVRSHDEPPRSMGLIQQPRVSSEPRGPNQSEGAQRRPAPHGITSRMAAEPSRRAFADAQSRTSRHEPRGGRIGASRMPSTALDRSVSGRGTRTSRRKRRSAGGTALRGCPRRLSTAWYRARRSDIA